MTNLQLVPKPDLARLAELAVAPLASPCSRMSYVGYLKRFLAWAAGKDLRRETIALYVARLRADGKSSSVLAQNMKAIRLLAFEAHQRRLISQHDLGAILSLKTPRPKGNRAGNWLQLEDVKALIALPDRQQHDGLRDACVLGMLVGCGLRRAEVSDMTWDKYQQREGRWCFVDLKGKGDKIRTVPIPQWVADDLERWKRVNPTEGKLIGTSRVNVWYIVNRYIKQLAQIEGHEHCAGVAPHDLRRTLAKLMRKAGTPLEQISLTLGHSDLKTTAMYLGIDLELAKGKAGVDSVRMD